MFICHNFEGKNKKIFILISLYYFFNKKIKFDYNFKIYHSLIILNFIKPD